MKKINFRNQEAVFTKRLKLQSSIIVKEDGEPKTSEYKNYLQLLEKAGHNFSRSSPRQDEQLQECKSELQWVRNTAFNRPIITETKDSRCKNVQISLSKPVRERASFVLGSPLAYEFSRQGLKNIGHGLLSNPLPNKTDLAETGTQSFLSQVECPEEECRSENIFIRKRYKLLHLASKTLAVDMDDLSANRTIFISEFLQRQGIDNVVQPDGLCLNTRETSLFTQFHSYKTPLLDCCYKERLEMSDSDCREIVIPLSGETIWQETDSLSFLCKQANSTEQFSKRRRLEYPMGIKNINYFEESDDCCSEPSTEPLHDGFECCSSHDLPLELHTPGIKTLCYWAKQEESCSVDERSSSQYLEGFYNGCLSEHPEEALSLPLICWGDRHEDNIDLALVPSNVERNMQSNSVFLGKDHLWNVNSQCKAMSFCSQTFPPYCLSSNLDALQTNLEEHIPFITVEMMLQRENKRSVSAQMFDYSPRMAKTYKVNNSLRSNKPMMSLVEGVFSHDYQCQKAFVSSGLDCEVNERASPPAESITANSILPIQCLHSYNGKRDYNANHCYYPESELSLCDNEYSQANRLSEFMPETFNMHKLSSFLSASLCKEQLIMQFKSDSSPLNRFEDYFSEG